MKLNDNQMDLETTFGDTIAFAFQMENLGEDLDSAFFTVKENYTDENALLQISLGAGIEKIESSETDEQDMYSVHIPPEVAIALPVGLYYYDLQVGLRGDIFTLLKGILKVTFDVTRE